MSAPRRSRRTAAAATAQRTEAELITHIKSLKTMAELGVLKAQMEGEMIPKTKAIKRALDEQEEEIQREQEDDVASPEEVAAQGRRLKREMRKLHAKPKKSTLFFGPGTRKKSRGRRAMEAEVEADLQRALEAENARIQAANAEAARDPVMSNLANRFGRATLGSVNRGAQATYSRKGVPGYHFKEEGGSRRSKRVGKGRSRRSRR